MRTLAMNLWVLLVLLGICLGAGVVVIFGLIPRMSFIFLKAKLLAIRGNFSRQR